MFMSNGTAADEVRTRMEELRHDFRRDVGRSAENMRVLLDWRHYLATYPWLCVTGAAALGFLLVPKRAKVVWLSPEALAELATRGQAAVKTQGVTGSKGPGIMANLTGAAARMALQAVGGHLTQYFEGRFRKGIDPSAASRQPEV
jgi:hypothetical protein